MLKNDIWIAQQALKEMIHPFCPRQIRANGSPVISYGLSSYGYDIRLSDKEFFIFRHIPGKVVNPKRFSQENLEKAELHKGRQGSYFIIPAHSYGLGVSLERIRMPVNAMAICMGKSTYARSGIIANITPLEPGWEGHITLEISNSSSADCMVFANEGIVQLVFFEGEPCDINYSDRNGKYQNQNQEVTIARV